MDDATLAQMDALIREPHGIVLMTGPTGSGQTTTLYAGLSRLDPKAMNIMTVEDPIEYALDGINKTQTNSRIVISRSEERRAGIEWVRTYSSRGWPCPTKTKN